MAQLNDNSDLLILSEDDTNMDTLVLDDTVATTTNEPELITFDDMNLDLETETKIDAVSEDNSANLDLSSFWTDSTPTITTIEVKTEASNDLNFDLTDTNTVSTVDNVAVTTPNLDFNSSNTVNTTVITENVWTMVSILDKAIHELETRSDVIVSEITTEENNISDLKSKIAKLESEVVVSETKVSELTDEKTMIAKNIKSLDKMKQIEHAAQKKAA